MAIPNVFTQPLTTDRGTEYFSALIGRGMTGDLVVLVPLNPGEEPMWAMCELSSRDAAEMITLVEDSFSRGVDDGKPATLRDELKRHPWILPGVALTASAALGTALPGIIDTLRGLWS